MANHWGIRLGHTLDQLNMNNSTVAGKLNVSRTAVGNWRNKGGNIEYENLRALADLLKVNWIWLRYGDEAVFDVPAPTSPPLAPVSQRLEIKTLLEDSKLLKAISEAKEFGRWRLNLIDDSASLDEVAASNVGLQAGEVTTIQQLHAFTHPEDRAWAWEELDKCIQEDRKVFHIIHRIIVHGETKAVEKIGYVVKDNLGLASECIGVVRVVKEPNHNGNGDV